MFKLISLVIVVLIVYAVVVNVFGDLLLRGGQCAGIC